jgi:hypothetical protein
MTGILDHIAKSTSAARFSQFRPASPQHFFALRLAQRLNDGEAAHHYVELSDRYSQAQLLTAYRRAKANAPHSDLARSFHAELAHRGTHNGNGVNHQRLAAIRIERRTIAVAIFDGNRLIYPPIARQLSSDPEKALGSAAAFISHIRDRCSFDTAALEALPEGGGAQRSHLAKIISDVLAERAVVIWQIAKPEIIRAFGQPPLRFRKQVREVISAMWPEVNGGFGSPMIKDALALGLYCQVEQLLNLEN